METNNKNPYLDIVTQNTVIPNALLDYHRDLGLSPEETLFLIVLLRLKNTKAVVSVRAIARDTIYTENEAMSFIGPLIDRGFLSLGGDGNVALDGLFDKMIEARSWSVLKTEQKIRKERKHTKEDKAFSELYHCFEEEMGRPLSPIEGEQITYWYKNQKIPVELIMLGLKRAVLLGKYNFRYVDAILSSWSKEGVRTVEDVERIEAKPKNSRIVNSPVQNQRIFRGEQRPDPDEPDIVL